MDLSSKLLAEGEYESKSTIASRPQMYTHKSDGHKRPIIKVAYVSLLAITLIACLGLMFRGMMHSDDAWGKFKHRHSDRLEKGDESPFHWKPCSGYDPAFLFECGTLMTPLNHLDANDTRRIPVGLIRYRAQKKPFLGSVLVNPGGPGGSGIDMVKGTGPDISNIIGGQHDVVGFDPRGIGESSPVICFGRAAEHIAFDRENGNMVSPGAPGFKVSLKEFAAWRSTLAAGCKQYSGEFLDYVSTAFTARDMDFIRENLGEEVLNYWGFSYGTFLGMTYANMFPDRIGRFMIDGVTDPETFAGSYLDWSRGSLLHMDGVFEVFGQACEKAGPSRCALADVASNPAIILKYSLNATKSTSLASSTISTLLKKYLFELAESPLPAPNAIFPGVLTAGTATALKTGDPSAIVDYANAGASPSDILCPLKDASGTNGFRAVKCNDGDDDSAISLEEWDRVAEEVEQISFLAGRGWTYLGLICKYWPSRPVESNTMDPVTPLESAKKVARLLGPKNSVLVVQDGHGHCVMSQPGSCMIDTITDFFTSGILPEKERQCKSDYILFPPAEGTWSTKEKVSTMEADMKGRSALKIAEMVHRVAALRKA
ncbi:Alpha/Beta hydrolase protein [Chytridium lagenaria]|nr:Alpha/Beta hydrolase protein [Chytridium lagenaria]